MSAARQGTRAAQRRAAKHWSNERIIGAMQVLLRRKGGLSLAELAAELKVSPRRIVELTHWVLGPDPALGLQGAEFTPVFRRGPQGMQVHAGLGLAKALERLAVIGANEAGLALAGLRRLQQLGPAPRRRILQALAARLARSEAAQAAGNNGSLAQPLPILDLWALLEQAIRQRRSLRFAYRGPGGFTQREVRPYVVFQAPGLDELYLEAWDQGRRPGVRRFRLALILRSSLQLGPSGPDFSAEEQAAFAKDRMDTDFESAFAPVLVQARGRAAAALADGELRARPGSQPVPKGWQAFELRYLQVPALVQALRAWAGEVSVQGPGEFRDAWAREMGALRKLYGVK